METITEEEITEAIGKTGKKGLAWDCITIWVIKLISSTTVVELLALSEAAGVDLEDIDIGWMEKEVIKSREHDDEETTNKADDSPKNARDLKWMPKEVSKIMVKVMSPQAINRGTTRTGTYLIRRILANALENEEMICGRLYLLQSEKKKKKSKTGLPSKKTTRPITVSSVIQKLLEKILLKRITDLVIRNTEVENAGFKPYMSCEL